MQHAVGVLEAGLCTHVLVSYGHNGRSSDSMLRLFTDFTGDEGAFGHFGASSGYALAARRAMYTHGTGPETWKHIAVGQRKWANLTPRAMFHVQPMTFDDYYASRPIVDPFRLFDCCIIGDGGRAYVVTSAERARDLPHHPVLIMGLGQHNPSGDVQTMGCMTGGTGAKRAGEMAFRMAGIGREDVDACEIYDCFTYTVEVTLQDYGFFAPGEGEAWFSGGRIEPGGSLPVNTSGGLLSESYFMGLTPLTEAVMQLMGRCGDRQLGSATGTKSPQIILCSDNGAILQTHSCTILRRA